MGGEGGIEGQEGRLGEGELGYALVVVGAETVSVGLSGETISETLQDGVEGGEGRGRGRRGAARSRSAR